METQKRKISELEDVAIETIQTKVHRGKKPRQFLTKSQQSTG